MTVLALRPNGDYSVALTRSTGSDNYALVDEAVLETGDYVYRTPNSYAADIYGLPNHTTESGVISKVTLKAYLHRTGSASTCYAMLSVEMGGTRYDGDEITVTTTNTLYTVEHTTNPNTGSAWTWQNIDDLVAGCRLKSTGLGAECRCYQFWVEVDYTVASTFLHGIMQHRFIPSFTGGK